MSLSFHKSNLRVSTPPTEYLTGRSWETLLKFHEPESDLLVHIAFFFFFFCAPKVKVVHVDFLMNSEFCKFVCTLKSLSLNPIAHVIVR